MDRFLITGFSGFVSKHFLDYLERQQQAVEVLGLDLFDPSFDLSGYKHLACTFSKADLLDKEQVEAIIGRFRPDYVLHLASYSSVAYSWQHPVESFANNTNIFLNLLENIRRLGIRCRVLSVGSSEEYGNVSPADIPLKEDHPLRPVSPYAVARVSQEMLSEIYVNGYNMDIVLTRSFNNIGPGQRDVFVVSSFAKKLVELKSSGAKEITTGDTTIIRDFVDVRDVVEAYYLLFKKGKKGEIYNICSGKGTSLDEIIKNLSKQLGIAVSQKTDPKLVRPSDNKVIIGSNEKIRSHIGWQNSIPLEKSLKDIIEYHQQLVKA